MATGNENMGSVTAEQIETFAQQVADRLGFKFEWTETEPSIWIGGKILIRRSLVGRYPWEAYQEVLHEAAHFRLGRGGHGSEFHDIFAGLIQDFLGGGGGYISAYKLPFADDEEEDREPINAPS